MESETAVSLSPATAPISISPSQENGSDSSHLESLVSAGEEDFETASDPDSASESEDSDDLKRTPLPGKSAMPIVEVTRVGDVDENPSLVDEEGVLNENLNPGENSKGGVLGVGEKEPLEDLISGEVKAEKTLPENSTVGEAIETEAETKENGISDVQDEKDEILGGDSSEEAPKSNIIGEGDLKPVEVELNAVGVAAGVEENGTAFALDERKDENLGGGAEHEVATNPVVEGSRVSKPVEVESEAVRVEENGESFAQEENLGGSGGSEVVATSPVLEEEVDSQPEEVKLDVVEVEKDGAIDAVGSIQYNEGEAAVWVEKDGATDSAGFEQNLEGVSNSKPVEVESNSLKAEEIGIAVELKAVEGESNAVEAEEIGGSDILDANQNLDGVAESQVVESEKIGDANGAGSERSLDTVNVPTSETLESDSVEPKDVAQGAENNESLDGGSVSVEADMVKGSAEKLDVMNNSEVVDVNPDQASTDLEAKLSDAGEVISVQVLAEDSNSRGTERELLEISGVTENGNAHEISGESLLPISASDEKAEPDADGTRVADDDENSGPDEAEEEEDGTVSDQPPRVAILDSSETAKQIIKEMEEGSSSTNSISGFESSRDYPHQIDGQIASDSDEEVDTDEEGEGKELFDSAALAALLKAATGASSDGSITITSQDGTRIFSVDRPAGLGSSAPSLRPVPTRSTRPTLFSPSELAVSGEPENEMDDEEKKLHEKVEGIRVKFLRLVMRLGHSPEDTVAAQVLYRLSLAEGIRRGRQMGRAFSIEGSKKKALQREVEGEEDLDFSCNILVLGKTGVGKSATINSIFGVEKSHTNAFQPATTSVREISGVVDGVKIRVVDTPGLRASVMDQAMNRRILSSIKKYIKRCPPDIVLYVDRLDTQTRDFNDLPLLRSITSALGSSIWFNAIVALTHAASAPPEGPNGSPLSYEVFIAQRSHVVQHLIRQAAGDMRLMNPVALVENHPSCRRNREGERVLPNGLSWRPQMLLLCYSSKILSEANSLLKLQEPSPGKLFGFRLRSPPLPFLLSSLLQSRPHLKLSADQGGDNGDSDIDLDDFSDAEQEDEEDEYDQLPPFKPLRKYQIAKLTKEQKRAYFDEYDYRVKLLQKKQWKEELRRLKEMKKRGKSGRDDSAYGDMADDYDQDGAPAAVPVPLPDMVLPPSFDCDVPTYRYRFLEPTSQLLTRPVLDTHGWDHDCGYDGVSLEESLAIAGQFPAAVAVQITKDKKEFNIHLDSSVSAKHGENGSTLAGFDIQSVGKQLAYILRSETKFKNMKKNKTAAGISVTFLGETVATGLKVEDQLSIGKRMSLVASTGAVRAQGDMAYGANLEVRLREKDYPIGQALSTLGLSLLKWHGDLALGANLQSQINIGRNSKVAVRVGLNNKLSGQITVRTSTSEQLQLALVGILPVAVSIFRSIWPGESFLVH